MRPGPRSGGLAHWLLLVVLAFALGGCAGLSGLLRAALPEPTPPHAGVAVDQAGAPDADAVTSAPTGGPDLTIVTASLDAEDQRPQGGLAVADDSPGYSPDAPQVAMAAETDAPVDVAQQPQSGGPPPEVQIEEYDPWEPFNEAMFEFNRSLDRWVIKPVAKVYRKIVPDFFQERIDSAFENVRSIPRFVNCALEGRFAGAGTEVARLVLNTTLGMGGLGDVARREPFNLQPCKKDMGLTLGTWGIGPGPYLILPFLPPLTVRDAVGYFADGAMDPMAYFIPFFPELFALRAGDTINNRALNIDLYQGFEEATVELYSALRNAYLQRRQKLLQE